MQCMASQPAFGVQCQKHGSRDGFECAQLRSSIRPNSPLASASRASTLPWCVDATRGHTARVYCLQELGGLVAEGDKSAKEEFDAYLQAVADDMRNMDYSVQDVLA